MTQNINKLAFAIEFYSFCDLKD